MARTYIGTYYPSSRSRNHSRTRRMQSARRIQPDAKNLSRLSNGCFYLKREFMLSHCPYLVDVDRHTARYFPHYPSSSRIKLPSFTIFIEPQPQIQERTYSRTEHLNPIVIRRSVLYSGSKHADSYSEFGSLTTINTSFPALLGLGYP